MDSMRSAASAALLLVLLASPLAARQAPDPPVTVDAVGVMRWTASGEEVALFGVNYTTPFAYAYRAHGYVGAERKEAIDADVAHLARLGVQAYRIHVWDREISDRQGNLVANDHLDLLDYLIHRLEERGIKVVLTPIFHGGPGYPERNPVTNGFSEDYSKGDMTVSPEARRVQANYFRQFVSHLNPYSGRSYRDDPDLLAIEIFNEPSHPAPPAEQTRYIDEMAAAIRSTGFRKPIFYNISIGWSDAHARAVCSARIQGVTFQWYPSGLVRGSTVQANMLPNVDRYPIPFMGVPECRDKARVVYEFDAADVMGSYLYPAMARAFRGAGMQWATQFAYDPLAIAHVNTEYQTHYLNLVHTPKKAISFLIAGEAFRRLPRGASFGAYPHSASFGPFRVSYPEELSEMVTADAFLHSNGTATRPPSPGSLTRIAGYGSSPVVAYEGRGAYFLDRLEEGVWRLELYPDAVQVADPFGRASLSREVTRLYHREWPMRINLPDLGADFTIRKADGSVPPATASGGSFAARPGVYVLRRRGVAGARWNDPDARFGNLRLGELHLPQAGDSATVVVHRPPLEVPADAPLPIRVEVGSSAAPARVELWWRRVGALDFSRVEMRRAAGIEYEASVPTAGVMAGAIEYAVRVGEGSAARTFPGGRAGGQPGDTLWQVTVARAGAPIVLFDVQRDAQRILSPHPYRYVQFRNETVAGSTPQRRAVRVEVESFDPDPHHYALRSFVGDAGAPRVRGATGYDRLKVTARSSGAAAEKLEVALTQVDGTAWGATVDLTPEWREIEVPLASLRPVRLALLPRPYPEFLPNELPEIPADGTLEVTRVEGVQLRIGAELYDAAARAGRHGFEVERVVLERAP